MDDSTSMRVLEVGSASLVVTLAGFVGASWAEALEAELGRSGRKRVIVDLLDATDVDGEVQSVLIRHAERSPLTVVAGPRLLHVFELTRRSRSLRLGRSLWEAVAAAG